MCACVCVWVAPEKVLLFKCAQREKTMKQLHSSGGHLGKLERLFSYWLSFLRRPESADVNKKATSVLLSLQPAGEGCAAAK